MKKLYYLIVLTLILGLVFTGCLLSNVGQVPTSEQSGITYLTKAVPPSVGLVGLWHFDEGSGTTANDSSGNGNTGTLTNMDTATCWVDGNFGKALNFDGVNDYVSVDDSTSLSSIENGGTWELWIKPNSDLRAGKWIGFLDTAPSLVGAVQSIVDPSNRLRAGFGGVFGAMWSIDADWTGEWHHIAGTWNQEVNPTVTLYVDGVQKAQATPTVTVRVDLLDIGRLNNGNNFDGIIDEVRIWDGALTAEQIEASYNGGLRKELDQTTANLGAHVGVTLDVVVAFDPSVTVFDMLPPELRYIPGTFKVNGIQDIPTVDGQEIYYDLELGVYTITFDAQVTSAEAVATLVTNEATSDGALASADLTINPYAGFTKGAVPRDEYGYSDGIIEVGEEIRWDVTITVTNIPGDEIALMSNIVVQDRFGGELEIHEDHEDYYVSTGLLEVKLSGKTDKPKIKWSGFNLDDDTLETANLIVSTDINPGGHHSYSTASTAGEEYEMNSGAVLKFTDSGTDGTGFQLSAHTPQITVVVYEP
jgi:hypothetical protein